MSGPLLHLVLVLVLAAVLGVLGLEAWHSLEHALPPLLAAPLNAKEVTT